MLYKPSARLERVVARSSSASECASPRARGRAWFKVLVREARRDEGCASKVVRRSRRARDNCESKVVRGVQCVCGSDEARADAQCAKVGGPSVERRDEGGASLLLLLLGVMCASVVVTRAAKRSCCAVAGNRSSEIVCRRA